MEINFLQGWRYELGSFAKFTTMFIHGDKRIVRARADFVPPAPAFAVIFERRWRRLGGSEHYDDIVICNGQGVYKNGTSKLQQQLNAMSQIEQTALVNGNITIYPNPATNEITLSYTLDETDKARFIIYDMLGNRVKEEKVNTSYNSQKINTSNLASGVYTY